MHVHGAAPVLPHAETHSEYLPRPENPHLIEARRMAQSINATKNVDPETGYKIYDSLVTSLVENTLALAKQYEYAPEPREWSCAQRAVWRFAHAPYERRATIVAERSVHSAMKAFASVNAGRWLVCCPFPSCHGTQYASFHDRRFWCVECEHKAIEGQWLEVVWPDHVAVEAWLGLRPNEAKHWNPGESAEDIAEQDVVALGVN